MRIIQTLLVLFLYNAYNVPWEYCSVLVAAGVSFLAFKFHEIFFIFFLVGCLLSKNTDNFELEQRNRRTPPLPPVLPPDIRHLSILFIFFFQKLKNIPIIL